VSSTGQVVRSSPRRRVRLRIVTSRGSSLTVNVSAGGFCTGMMRVLPAGTPLDGTIHLDGREAFFSGHVVWARPGNPRLNLMGTMGVRFGEIDADFARNLGTGEVQGSSPGNAARRTAPRTAGERHSA
jgi:hypothetical protein